MKNESLVVIDVGDAKGNPALQSILQLESVAGLEVHEKEIALCPENVVHVVPIIQIVESIAGVTA